MNIYYNELVRELENRINEQKKTSRLLKKNDNTQATESDYVIANWEYCLKSKSLVHSKSFYSIIKDTDQSKVFNPFRLFRRLPTDDFKRTREYFHYSMLNNSPIGIVVRIKNFHNQIRLLYVKAKLEYDENNHPSKFVGTVQDFTDIDIAINSESEQLSQINTKIETSESDLLIASFPNGKILNHNLEISNLFKVSEDYFCGKNIFNLDIWIDDNSKKEFIELIISQGIAEDFSIRIRRSKSYDVDARINAKKMEIGNGIFLVITSISIKDDADDIDRPLHKGYCFRNVSENEDEFVLLMDFQYRLFFIDQKFLRLVSKDFWELKSKTFLTLVHRDNIFETSNYLKNLFRSNESFSFENKILGKNKIFRIAWNMRIETLPDSNRIVIATGRKIESDEGIATHHSSGIRFGNCITEKYFEETLNNSPIAYFRLNKKLQFEYVNQKWLSHHKKNLSQVGGKDFYMLFPLYYKDKLIMEMNKVLSGKTEEGIFYLLKENKQADYFSYKIWPIVNQGKVVGVEGFEIDITQVKQAEEYLKESESKYRIISENIPVLVYSVLPDKNLTVILISGRIREITGYNKNDFFEKPHLLNSIVSEKDKTIFEKSFSEVINAGSRLYIEYRIITKQGAVKWVRNVATPFYGNVNNVARISGFIEDIDERKNTEKALKTSERKFRSLFEDSQDCIYISSSDGKMIDINQAGLKLFGYDKREILSMNAMELYHEIAERFRFQRIMEKQNYVKDFEVKLKCKNGDIIDCLLSTTIIRDEKGEVSGYQGIIRDITESKKAEKEIIQAKEDAEKADKLKSEFLAQISHEIRTPINSMLSFSKLISEDLTGLIDEEKAEYFAILDRSGKRIIRTVDLILNMSEIQIGSYKPKLQKIDLAEMIVEMYGEYKNLAYHKNLHFNFIIPEEESFILSDHYSTTQIISNLLDNAVKYTDAGSVCISIEMEDENVIVSVADTGIGISQKYIPHLFESFSQEEQGYTRKFEGSGLGLTLVKKYCELNFADISVESEKGKGSTFTVRFKKYLE